MDRGKQRVTYLMSLKMGGRKAFGRNNKVRKIIKSYKEQINVENHDCIHPEGHIKEYI